MLRNGRATGMLAQNDMAVADPDGLGRHNLVGDFLLDQAVLMDAGFVRERVGADDGLVRLHGYAGNLRQQARGFINLICFDLGGKAEHIFSRGQRHDDFFHRRVSGPFPDAVDRALHLPGARADGGERIGHRQPQIVVAVDGDDRIAHVFHTIEQKGDEAAELFGNGVADRVGNIDGDGARVNHGGNHLSQIIPVRARGVHR